MPKGATPRKYSPEEKIALINDWKQNCLSIKDLIEKYSIAKSTICDWIKIYCKDGFDGFTHTRQKVRTYSQEYKVSVVKDIKENKLSYTKAALKHKICRSVIRIWVIKYNEGGEKSLLNVRKHKKLK